MKTTITATAPSVYQMGSLRAFGLNVKPHRYDGGATGTLEFLTPEAAREHLRECAWIYNNNDPNGTDECLREMFADIERGHLTLDAVTACIQ